MTTLALSPAPRTPPARPTARMAEVAEVAGIIIRDSVRRRGDAPPAPRVQAFVYGECEPRLPILPFGRWRSREGNPDR